jgi:hypothetical protein
MITRNDKIIILYLLLLVGHVAHVFEEACIRGASDFSMVIAW